MGYPYIEPLLEDAVDPVTGSPKNVSECFDATIQVVGIIAGDTVRIEGSNEKTPTVWSIIQFEGSDDITASGYYSLETLPTWIRAKLQADAGGGTVSVFMRAGR